MNPFQKLKLRLCFGTILLIALYSCDESDQAGICAVAYLESYGDCAGVASCEQAAVDEYNRCIAEGVLFPVHFVVLTDSLKGTDSAVTYELTGIIDTLNRYFSVEDTTMPPDNRRKIVAFEFKSATLFAEATADSNDLVNYAWPDFSIDTRHDFKDMVNDIDTQYLMDTSAINVYIVDTWRTVDTIYKDVNTSHAKNNNDQPYLVIDYKRITGAAPRTGVEEHEMGHAFNLAHVCEPGATRNSSTNIMSSSGSFPIDSTFEQGTGVGDTTCFSGSSGQRDIGFNEEQSIIILNNASEIREVLGL